MELDRPLTSDETRRLAESWKKRYSIDATAEHSPSHENIQDANDANDANDVNDVNDVNDAVRANDTNLQAHVEGNSIFLLEREIFFIRSRYK